MAEVKEPVIVQVCKPVEDGTFTVCNCVMRNGVCVPTKSGKWYKFPRRGYKRQKVDEVVKSKTTTPLKEAAVLQTV